MPTHIVKFVSVFIFYMAGLLSAQPNSQVIVMDGANQRLRDKVGYHLTMLLRAMNEYSNLNDPSQPASRDIKELFSGSGMASYDSLLKHTRIWSNQMKYEVGLVKYLAKEYMIRDISVRVDLNGSEGDPNQYLVFTCDNDGKITSMNFGIEKHNVDRILGSAEILNEIEQRNIITHFLDTFASSYNHKNIRAIDTVLDDNALIIVGHVVRSMPTKKQCSHDNSTMQMEDIEMILTSKPQYIAKLTEAFRRNAFVHVAFDSIEIYRHPEKPDFYGVTLRQRWRSSTYHDDGYLFLLIEFKGHNQAIIHIRTWQPRRFKDGSTMNLGHIKIIN